MQPTPEDYAFSRLIAYAAYQWPGYQDAPHHRLIARHLEAVERGEIKRLMITMPPRHGKSMLASEYFPAWYMGRNPDHYVVTATYAQDLADDFGRKVKNQIVDPTFQGVFPGVSLAGDSKSSKRFHVEAQEGGVEHALTQKGAFYAVGVGGPLTGRGAHLLLIDDPVKNREDAESEVTRKKIKDWYTSTAYTRLMPGGRIVIIQCMVGDTPLLMADGSERPLRDVRPGDVVASYQDGVVTTARVKNWANQGSDHTFTITTKSGVTVQANKRHPFLVEKYGVQEWVRLADLAIGALVVRVMPCAVGTDEIVSIDYSGMEDVYDIQVEGTENFIANGLVSHNTRWHEDDLSGWLQAEHAHEGWVTLNLPAIAEGPDALGRVEGEALWPEMYGVEDLARIKRAVSVTSSRDWDSLYQQRPAPESGDYFKREWIIPVAVVPPREEMMVYGGSDYAVTANGGDYTVHAVLGLASDGRMYLLDLWRAQASSDVWVDSFCALVRKWKPVGWAEETGQIKSGVGPFLIKQMIETESYVAREQFATRGDKAIRAQSIRGRMAMQGLHVPQGAPWLTDFISELMSFPVGVHDDQVDALGLVGQLMDRMSNGNVAKKIMTTNYAVPGGVRAPRMVEGRGRR